MAGKWENSTTKNDCPDKSPILMYSGSGNYIIEPFLRIASQGNTEMVKKRHLVVLFHLKDLQLDNDNETVHSNTDWGICIK